MKNFLRFAAVAVALALPAVGVVYDEIFASKPPSTCSLEKARQKGKSCAFRAAPKKPAPRSTPTLSTHTARHS